MAYHSFCFDSSGRSWKRCKSKGAGAGCIRRKTVCKLFYLDGPETGTSFQPYYIKVSLLHIYRKISKYDCYEE